ncbi:hypothetical protein ANACOL_04009 [Anaerotruncus colihominis DSM 17241]|uniref:Uncharacterized protein n=1 Tax=Anaerotruncus colihominis DSM 17241 TaxID=445972 RepID=B0PGY8_9FIRM|nr:hypothetical protein ANACOL_04009 [Anaerotruncus colihominis DSM 17241]
MGVKKIGGLAADLQALLTDSPDGGMLKLIVWACDDGKKA